VKAIGKLALAIAKCHAKACDLAFKSMPFDVGGCETAAKAKFDVTFDKLVQQGICPPCAIANAPTFRDQLGAFLDGAKGQAYCAGSTPLP